MAIPVAGNGLLGNIKASVVNVFYHISYRVGLGVDPGTEVTKTDICRFIRVFSSLVIMLLAVVSLVMSLTKVEVAPNDSMKFSSDSSEESIDTSL